MEVYCLDFLAKEIHLMTLYLHAHLGVCLAQACFAAETQFITHTVGRVLEALELDSMPNNTKGYETLLDLVENTCADSFDLYY